MTFPASVKAALQRTAALLAGLTVKAHGGLVRLWCLPVRLYRTYISPLKPAGTCRFTPTCSRYFLDAVREWGIVAGTLMGVWRVLRCNPFSKGGRDPVPLRSEVFARLGERFRGKRDGGPDESREIRDGQVPEDGDFPHSHDSRTEN